MRSEVGISSPLTELKEQDVQFTDIFNLQEIQHMQDLFSKSTGVASLITLPNGQAITRASNFCKMCALVRTSEKGLTNCMKSDAYIGTLNPCGVVIQQCLSSGLWDASVGINIDGKHIASWLIGQVRSVGVDIQKIINYADEIGVDKGKYRQALDEVPIMTIDKFQDIANMLAVFANELTEKAYVNYQLKKNIEEQERVNELLHKSEESLSITLNSIGDAVITTDTDGNIVTMNPIAEAMSGWRLCDAIGKPLKMVFRIINSNTNEPIENLVEKVIRTGKIIGLANHAILISKDGQRLHISDSAAPIRNKDRVICGVVLVFSDVTEKYEADEAIRKSEIKYRGLLNNLNSGVVVHAPDTSIMLSNPQASVLLGLSAEQLEGIEAIDPVWKFLDEYENPLPLDEYPVNRIIQSQTHIKDQLMGVFRPDKKDIVWVNVNGFPVFNSRNEITQIIISFDDVTTQKINSDKLNEKEKFLIQTQFIARMGSYVLDIRTGQWASSEMLDMIFGIDSNHDNSVDGWLSVIHPDWREMMSGYFKNEVIGEKKRFDKEYKIVRKSDFEERWVHGMGELIFDKNGNPIKLIGTIQDITDRKSIEENLRIKEEKYRNIFENIQDVFYQVDMNGKIFEVSPSAKFFPDFFDSTALTQDVNDLYANTEDRTKFMEMISKEGEVKDFELDLIGRTGALKHVSINAKLMKDEFGNPTHINGAIRDITKRKNAQNALLESEKFLKEIQSIAQIGNWSIDLKSGRLTSSEILDNIFGFDSMTDKTIKTINAIIHPDWNKVVSEYFLNVVIRNNTKFDTKFKIIRLSDKSERWVHGIGELKLDENNQPNIMIGTIQDITKRKKAKEALQASQEELKKYAAHLQSVREEERNILAREIHDDLGQILIAMKIDLGLLKQNVLKTVAEDEYENVKIRFDELNGIVDSTLMSARRIMTDLRPEVLDMLGFTDTVKQHLNSFQLRHKIQCSFENYTSKLTLNSEQSVALFRIVQEAMNNVAKHSRATQAKVLLTQTNDSLSLKIEDNGVGFDQNERKKTESYGLIGIRERVFLLDGKLDISSTKGQGTLINITMPYLCDFNYN